VTPPFYFQDLPFLEKDNFSTIVEKDIPRPVFWLVILNGLLLAEEILILRKLRSLLHCAISENKTSVRPKIPK